MKTARLADRYCVSHGKDFRLKDVDPNDTWHADEDRAKALLADAVEAASELQEKLYAQGKWAVLLIFQAMDAAGKDSAIKHVLSGINPQGCHVTSFKAPSVRELDHDFLWRANQALPERGNIGVFNRSYYEETLVVRVHSSILKAQNLPEKLVGKRIWKERFEDINAYESYLGHNGVVVRKFFLHVSKDEQKKRLLSRLDDPKKNWKFEAGDLRERELWDEYMEVYEEMIQRTSTKCAPWYVVPADNKWFTRLVVASAVIETLKSLKPGFPKVTAEQRAQLALSRLALGGKDAAADASA